MIFDKNNLRNDAAAFGNIGYSISRHRRRSRFERWVRNWRATHEKPAPISLGRLAWLICLLCFGVLLMRTGLAFCSSALARRGGQVSEYSMTIETEKRTPLPDVNTGEKGNIRLKWETDRKQSNRTGRMSGRAERRRNITASALSSPSSLLWR